MRITRQITLARSGVRHWFELFRRRLWDSGLQTSGPVSVQVDVGKIVFQGNATTTTGKDAYIRVIVSIGPETEHQVEIATTVETAEPGTRRILALPKRVSHRKVRAVPAWHLEDPEADENALSKLLDDAWAIIEQSALDVRDKRTVRRVVAVLFTSGNWPPGRTEFGPYVLCSVGDPEPFTGTHVFLARRVDSFTGSTCREDWHDALNTVAMMIAVLTGRLVQVNRNFVPKYVVERVGQVPSSYYPIVEKEEDSKLLRFAETSGPAACASAYSREALGSSVLGFIPDDLGAVIERYETLPDDRRTIIDDALNMLRLALDYQTELPTVALSAYWFALERLVDWDKTISKYGDASCNRGHRNPRSQAAILDLMQNLDVIDKSQREDVGAVLSAIRGDFRIGLVHRARLAGGDFGTNEEVWAATEPEGAPSHAQIRSLLRRGEECLRAVLVAILERVRDGA